MPHYDLHSIPDTNNLFFSCMKYAATTFALSFWSQQLSNVWLLGLQRDVLQSKMSKIDILDFDENLRKINWILLSKA